MSQNFTFIANSSDIRLNEMQRFIVEGKKILVCNVEGNFYALDDTCSHEEASLYRGNLTGNCVTCPMHGARFDVITGAPLDEPATEPVRTYKLKLEGGVLSIALDD